MTYTDLATNLAFSAGGLLVGFVLGRVAPTRHGPHSDVMSTTTSDDAAAHPHSRITKITSYVLFFLGIITAAVAAYASVQRYDDSEHFRRTAECQASWNQAFRTVLTERTKASDRERAAMRTMLGVVLSTEATPEARRQAVTTYYDVLRAADDTRAINPLPASDRC